VLKKIGRKTKEETHRGEDEAEAREKRQNAEDKGKGRCYPQRANFELAKRGERASGREMDMHIES